MTALNLPQYSPSISDDISTQTQKQLNLLPDVRSKSQSLAKALHFPFSIQTKTEWEQFFQVINTLLNLPDIPLELIRYLSDKENYNVYEEWSKAYRQYLSVLNSILKDYNRNVLSTNIAATEIEWKQAQQSWFLPKWLQTRKIKKQLAVFRNAPFNNDTELEQLFSYNNQLQEVKSLLQQSRFGVVQQSLKNLFKDEQTDLSDIDNKSSLIQQLSI